MLYAWVMLRIMQQARPYRARITDEAAQMLNPPNIDKDWFLSVLEERRQSVRGLARHMEIDASAVSRMLSGERRMKMEEAATIARFLGVNVKEVLRHVGVAVDLDGQPTRVLLVATIDERGAMNRLKTPRPLPQAVIDRVHAAIGDTNTKVIAAQIRADKGLLALLDDAVVLFKHTEGVDPACVDALTVARTIDGEMGLGRMLKVRKTGEAVGMDITGKIYERDLVMATPVLAIIP